MADGTKKRWLRALVGVAGIVVLLLILSIVLVQFPATEQPLNVDAIVVLGQPDDYSMGKANELLAAGVSDHLVISTPFGEPGDICQKPPTNITVTCFVPDPSTTRGEAQEIGRMVAANGWHDIAVVTWPTHISRSRMLIERCYEGDLEMVDYEDQMSLGGRIYEQLYQTGAYLKAFATPGC